MKRFIAVLLAALMLFSLAACGKDKENTDDTTSTATAAVLGREAYDKVVANNDLTLVNVWATWCTPCVGELGELQRVEDEYKNVGVVGILLDGVTSSLARDEATIDYAVALLDSKGASYTVVVPDEYLYETFCAQILYFPTSFLVDSSGNIVRSDIIGANDFDGWKAIIDSQLAA